ncbi:Glyoxalase/Bleomycin resistance protein/Dihydroxybiphenyl dioxygenase [Phyllosticta capitalensis]|uniref:Glyoxalase/Bleomycin resistance protein/Dihydroxybiphenyl dioxygenase n=1 Tax=Phyllosticta capitalensis TaxID=121624 RepID=UPI00312D2D2D
MSAKFSIKALDHMVLYVASIEASVAFYTTHLGMAHTSFAPAGKAGEVRHALTFGQQKINLHAASSPYAPHARAPLSSTADFCLLTDTPVQEVAAALREGGGKDGEGAQVVMERTGARGRLRSVYVRDPDGNLVE